MNNAKRDMRFVTWLLVLTLLVVPIFVGFMPRVSALTDYNQTGQGDKLYQNGRGIFNSNLDPLTDVTTFTKSVSSLARQTPLVTDLDNDGINEIIVLAGDTVTLYNNKELDIIATFDIGSPGRMSNIITYDIDGDGRREIIFIVEEDEELWILDYNGTTLTNQTTYSIASLPSTPSGTLAGEFVINCQAANSCLMLYSGSIRAGFDPSGAERTLEAVKFNSTEATSDSHFNAAKTSTSSRSTYCMPPIREMSVNDYDNDGQQEFIMTVAFAGGFSGSADEEIHTHYLTLVGDNITADMDAVEIDTNADLVFSSSSSVGFRCDNAFPQKLMGAYFTAPLVEELKLSSGNKETVIAFATDFDEYHIQMIEADGDVPGGDRFPQILEGEGNIISNVMLSNVFPDSGLKDVCVMGFNNDEDELELLCGSKETTNDLGIGFLTSETVRFQRTNTEDFNVSEAYNNWNRIMHSTQQSNALTDLVDLTESIGAYGVNEVLFEDGAGFLSCSEGATCSLNRIFLNGVGDSVFFSIDVEKFGSEDTLALSSTNIFYFDDGLSNEPPTLTSVTFNPCIIDSVAKLNTTLQITVVSTDNNPVTLNQDPVSINTSIYLNNPAEQRQGVINVTSGSQNQFVFTLNQVGVGQIIEVFTFDSFNADIDLATQTFSVQPNGVEFGDSQCTVNFETLFDEQALEDVSFETPLQEDSIVIGVNTIAQTARTSGQTVWLIIMIALGLSIALSRYMEIMPQIGIATILILEVLLLILGTTLGFVPIGITIGIFVLLLIAAGLWIGQRAGAVQQN